MDKLIDYTVRAFGSNSSHSSYISFQCHRRNW